MWTGLWHHVSQVQCPVLQMGGVVGPENLEWLREEKGSQCDRSPPAELLFNALPLSLSLSLAASHTSSLPLPVPALSISLSLSLSLSHTHTHTHTHSLCLGATHSAALSWFISPWWSAEKRGFGSQAALAEGLDLGWQSWEQDCTWGIPVGPIRSRDFLQLGEYLHHKNLWRRETLAPAAQPLSAQEVPFSVSLCVSVCVQLWVCSPFQYALAWLLFLMQIQTAGRAAPRLLTETQTEPVIQVFAWL